MLTVTQKRDISNRVNSRLQSTLRNQAVDMSFIENIKQLVITSLNNKISNFRRNHPIIWGIFGIGRGIFNFCRRIIEPFINPIGFLRGIGNLVYRIFTNPMALIQDMVHNCVKYAVNDPIAFATDTIINILLIALPYVRTTGGVTHYHTTQTATTTATVDKAAQASALSTDVINKALTFDPRGISLPPRIPKLSVELTSTAPSSSLSNSSTLFSLKSSTTERDQKKPTTTVNQFKKTS